MASIARNLQAITAQLPAGVSLVAVSKFHPVDEVREAYDAGQRLFGENHAQELVAKVPQLPADISWQFIGHLQTNKVRMIMPSVAMIQSIDSLKLLHVVSKEAVRINRTVDVLLQLHVAKELTKTGFTVDEVLQHAATGAFAQVPGVRFRGVMGMATQTTDMAQVAHEFATIRHTFDELQRQYFAGDAAFNQVSMGMSHDWHVAVEQGATMIRVGTDIFGPREY